MEYIPGNGETCYVPVVNGEELHYMAETEDIALLLGLGFKYDGESSRFAKMACRMLNIKSVWSE